MSGFSGVGDGAPWTAYTPTITSQGGTPTSTTPTGRYKQIGKTVFYEIVVTITTKGTATGGIRATLPLTAAAFAFVGTGYESNTTGKSGATFISPVASTYASLSQADGTTFWVDGYVVSMTGIYEVP